MAPRRRIHGGKSYGRTQAIIDFAEDSWEEFDSWCLMHGLKESPWHLPSYRFGALVTAFMKDDRVPEDVAKINSSLADSDRIPHPFNDPKFVRTLKSMAQSLNAQRNKTAVVVGNVIYDPRLVDDLPIEERKRQEAIAQGKKYRVPEWWRGEQANYKIAKQMMVTLPKKAGKSVPVKE